MASGLADGHGFGKNMIRKSVDSGVWGRGVWIDLSEWTKDLKIFVSPVNDHQSRISGGF